MHVAKLQKSLDKLAVLRNTSVFADVPESVLNETASRSGTRQLKPGEVLFSEHDKATALYVVASGELRSIRQNAKGREQVLSTDRPGTVLAAAPIFNGGRYYSTVIADTHALVLCIETHDMQRLCREHPELLWALATLFAHRVRHYAELIETLALRNVDQRLAQYLFTICQEQGSIGSDTCRIQITFTQAEMASRIGSTREVVCRSLAHLEREGLIRTEGTRAVAIPSVRALSKFAGVDSELEEPRLLSELPTDVA